MRRRLVLIYLSLFGVAIAALAIPFAEAVAARETQRVFIRQQEDTARFASQGALAIQSGRHVRLRAELRRHRELFGVDAAVIDADMSVVASTSVVDGRIRDLAADGLSGRRSPAAGPVMPWDRGPLGVVEPVIYDDDSIGAAVTLAPTGALRARIATMWGLLALAGAAALGACWLAARRLARWALRPVADLDAAAHEIAEGHLDARVPQDTGPPELRRLTESFNAMAQAVRASLERQRRFVSQASHQLRTPLGVLRLQLENREHGLAVEETERMARIIDQMLALARAEEAGRAVKPADAERIARGRVAAWRGRAADRGVDIGLTGSLDRPVAARPGVLDQSLDALIDNALKFGGRSITVRLDDLGDAAAVRVVDDGPGLDEQERVHAGERFWRGAAVQNLPGSGLGLSIVNALLETCGGRLELRDAVPRGLDARMILRTWSPGSNGSPPGEEGPDESRTRPAR